MHDLIIASSLLAMLVVPCLAAMSNEVPTDDID